MVQPEEVICHFLRRGQAGRRTWTSWSYGGSNKILCSYFDSCYLSYSEFWFGLCINIYLILTPLARGYFNIKDKCCRPRSKLIHSLYATTRCHQESGRKDLNQQLFLGSWQIRVACLDIYHRLGVCIYDPTYFSVRAPCHNQKLLQSLRHIPTKLGISSWFFNFIFIQRSQQVAGKFCFRLAIPASSCNFSLPVRHCLPAHDFPTVFPSSLQPIPLFSESLWQLQIVALKFCITPCLPAELWHFTLNRFISI